MIFRKNNTIDTLSQKTKDIICNSTLSNTEKLIYIVINNSLNKEKHCNLTNADIWDYLGKSKDTITKNISNLRSKNLISVTLNNHTGNYNRRYITINE